MNAKLNAEIPNKEMQEKVRHFYKTSDEYCRSLSAENEDFFKRYLSLVDRYAGNARTVLDAGCGTGLSTYLLSTRNKKVFGLDLSPLFLKKAKERTGCENIPFLSGDMIQLPFQDESFDLVVAYLVIEVLPDAKKGLEEMCRVLKKGGVIVIFNSNLLSPVWALLDIFRIITGGKGRPVWCDDFSSAVGMFARNLVMSMRKMVQRRPEFLYRQPNLAYDKVVGRGRESFYLACPKDILAVLNENAFKILRGHPAPSRMEKFFPPSFYAAIEIVAEKTHVELAPEGNK